MKALLILPILFLSISAPKESFALGIPTATNVDHVEVVVPNLNQAILFYVDVLGCDLVYRPSFTGTSSSAGSTNTSGIPPAPTAPTAMLRCGPVTNIQISETNSKDPNSYGGFSIYVGDIGRAVKYLRAKRVEFVEDPMTYTNEYVAQKKAIFLTPWKSRMELLTYSRPQPYEKTTTARTYGPGPEWVNH